MSGLTAAIERVFGEKPVNFHRLSGGDIAAVSRIDLKDGRRLVAKQPRSDQRDTSGIEARMLRYLKENSSLPVPLVLYQEPGLLVMEYLEAGGRMTASVERDAARHVAALHNLTADHHGLAFDTVIGRLPQPNNLQDGWISFFRNCRLLHMARLAWEAGGIDAAFFARIERFAEILDRFIEEPEAPSLLHGDLWDGNILVAGDKISGFIDPAISFGHAEMDLAFSTLFGTFGEDFFFAYREIRPIEPGFFEVRRDIYNLWPLLVHAALFGGGYIKNIDHILQQHGV